MKFDDLDTKMRRYEQSLDQSVLSDMFLVARLDGRGFSRLTKELCDFEAPFDVRFCDMMVNTVKELMRCGFKVVYGYTESDEISLLFHTDEDTFGRKVRKFNSILAGTASAAFSLQLGQSAIFDCRLVPLPSLERVKEITGKDVKFYKADILDKTALEEIFEKENIESCIHFAGLKAVGESVAKPWEYYNNNITGTLVLLDVMKRYGCKNIIFSSSATIYGDPAFIPITEECPKGVCTNPYGWTKSMLEQILTDIQKADNEWNVVILRYFNPIGAHISGRIGENPNGIPNNLMPYITQVAVGKLEKLGVFGNDYDTHDGTGVRDYIHVVDLAKGHVKALAKLEKGSGLNIYNLGTGTGYSVLDMVKSFEEANGVPVPYVIKDRRPGDIATCYADAKKAKDELGWEAENGIVEMCRDAWRWQKANPNGFED